ncbi:MULTISPECIES: tRNA (N6-threonylcarbamoyladenosine(37)-N6)-methyltransferase TrmO [unclassified Acinetobacter]|uniref:tRNA (N6-threonylcarbamoyladenosine(37)-N6)-methyltransferase TrmO n=1 Tax=unclassified Acinetobacter TaxID=196816 RepID=UPI0025761B60|nr:MULTISPECIES: tRNA (N6-threonylcarbamoyladenosine(37)-N6)-methyltransferase TrmO [unclassified Acinetobacter]MDM1765385.1 tRNA (N6-threonylcarbamoyladenosine(37)-N6)-methyltransferase TrmO [Acinetobacter sp. 226-1]MDM1768890.1 tRNA (N6-threonylcarbamoyladenosine(37)-N6)-methyltransferase TrmO [Acinetobacter sp. 226-4]
MTELTLPIIGYMHSPYKEKFGIPRQPNLVQVESYIEMLAPYNDLLAFEGIEEFSHLWLVWQFHENKNIEENQKFRPQVRPPRLGGNKKIGVFATRSMYRPAPIGLSVVQLKKVEKVGKSVRIYLTGSDLLEGTPIIDIKPYIQYSDALMNATSGYAQQEPIRKKVVWSENVQLTLENLLKTQKITAQTQYELEQVLSLDPRPAYQEDESRVYKMKFSNLDVSFKVSQIDIEIIKVQVLA